MSSIQNFEAKIQDFRLPDSKLGTRVNRREMKEAVRELLIDDGRVDPDEAAYLRAKLGESEFVGFSSGGAKGYIHNILALDHTSPAYPFELAQEVDKDAKLGGTQLAHQCHQPLRSDGPAGAEARPQDQPRHVDSDVRRIDVLQYQPLRALLGCGGQSALVGADP